MFKYLHAAMAAVALSAGVLHANNLGTVTSLRILTGYDGLKYIEIGHSGTDLQSTDGQDFTNAGKTLLAPIMIAWPADEATSMSTMSLLTRALSCQCITFEAIKGFATAEKHIVETAPTPVLATQYRFINL